MPFELYGYLSIKEPPTFLIPIFSVSGGNDLFVQCTDDRHTISEFAPFSESGFPFEEIRTGGQLNGIEFDTRAIGEAALYGVLSSPTGLVLETFERLVEIVSHRQDELREHPFFFIEWLSFSGQIDKLAHAISRAAEKIPNEHASRLWAKQELRYRIKPTENTLKRDAIDRLKFSPTFADTHRAINELSRHFSALDAADVMEIVNALQDNNQIRWILGDADVTEFYNQLLMRYESIMEYDTKVRLIDMLSPRSSPDRSM